MTTAYPLAWPAHKPRTAYPSASSFGARSVETARAIMQHELKLLGATGLILSTNIRLRNDGLPYSTQTPPQDKGVAIYFKWNGQDMCFSCDRWNKIQDNIYAIAMTIEALRGIKRWGSGDMLKQAFSGFVALPAPAAARTPEDVLGVRQGATHDEIEAAFRKKAFEAHPDHGGTTEAMDELKQARRRLLS